MLDKKIKLQTKLRIINKYCCLRQQAWKQIKMSNKIIILENKIYEIKGKNNFFFLHKINIFYKIYEPIPPTSRLNRA